jgi:hypothetical protein
MRVLVATLLGCVGCATSVDVTRVMSIADAANAQSSKFEPVAVIHEGVRTELPRGAHVERTHVAPTDQPDTVALASQDTVEMHGKFAPGDSIPGGGLVESSRSMGALIAGITLFTISYAPSAYIASQSQVDKSLFIPIAGPWMDLATRPACTPPIVAAGYSLPVDPCIGETITRAALVLSGAIQGLGAVITLFGLPTHAQVAGGDHGVHVSIVPTGLGAAAFGTF